MTEENRIIPKNKYLHSKIYKLQCDDGHIYIGHTTQKLSKRFSDHKMRSRIKQFQDMKIYKHINNIGWDKVKIVLISEHSFENKEQLIRQENIEISDPFCLNSFHSFIEHNSIKIEPSIKNKPNIKHKIWYQNNKERIKQKSRERYNINKNVILTKCKEYYNNNKENILIRNKIYNVNHKEQSDARNQKLICECGSEISKRNRSQHQKSIKHINYVRNL